MLNSVVKSFLVITAVTLVGGTLKMSFDQNIHKVQMSGSECTIKLVRRFINPASIISIISSGFKRTISSRTGISTEQLILKKIMNESSWTVMTKTAQHNRINRLNDNLEFTEKVHAYILFVRTQKDLAAILAFLANTSSWNPHANFILYMDIGVDRLERKGLLLSLINLAWKYLVINLIIIVPISENMNQQIITWFPFDEGNCGKQETRMHVLGECELGELVPNTINYFPDKVPMNLNKCSIKVGTLVWPPFILPPTKTISGNNSKITYNFEHGIEIALIKTIALHANFTIKFMSFEEPENWGNIEHNGTGLIGMLLRQEVDIALATFTPNQLYHQHFDFSIQYTQDKITWLVPTPDLKPPWQNLANIFQPQAWIASIFIYIVVSLVTYLLGVSPSKNLEHKKFQHLHGTFLVIWRIMCGSCSPIFPRTFKIRAFLFLWLLYCIHWTTAYTTYLISMLTTPVYYRQVNSFNDIIESKMEYGMLVSTTKYFQNEFNANHIDNVLIKNFKLCSSAASCVDRVVTKRDFAMAISRQYFEFIESNYKDQFGNPLIKTFHTDIVTTPVEMLLVKGHPLLPRFNGILLYVVQAGLINIWAKQIKQDALHLSLESITNLESNYKLSNKKVLTFYHLEGAFMALGFGLFIAFIQFGLEILVHKRQVKKK